MARIPIEHKPGGLNSDVVETDLGKSWYEEVKNLRQNKKGEWVNAPGYKSMLNVPSANVKAAIEINDDLSGDRFLLLQRGTVLTRVDYDIVNSPVFGYENESAASALTLPSGVTIGSSATLRFFVHSGVIRITGATVPLWYSYIDRTLFPDADDSGSQTILSWILEKSEISCPVVDIMDHNQHISGDGSNATYYLQVFGIFDDQQYTPLRAVNYDSSILTASNKTGELFSTSSDGGYSFIDIRLLTAGFGSANINQRMTGIVFAVGIGTYQVYDPDDIVWRIGQVLYFDENLDDIFYTHESNNLTYDGTNDDRINITANVMPDGWLMVGQTISLSNRWGSINNATINTVHLDGSGGIDYFELDTTIGNLLNGSLGTPENLAQTSIQLTRLWDYNSGSDYYDTRAVINLGSGPVTFQGFTGFAPSVEDNSPAFTHHAVIEGIAYVNTQEDTEEDQVRYSPVNQLDNFPVTNIFPTDFGTLDTIKALVKRDNRLVILKGDLIGQGNFVGGRFYHDTESPGDGLYPNFGYVLVGKTLFYIDKDDVYQFDGVRPAPLLTHQRVKNRFLDGLTSAAFLLENKLENELWIYLPDPGTYGEFLVFNPAMNEWYLRTVDYTPVGGFIDADRKACIYSANDILTYDHGSATFDESLTWEFTLKLHMERSARFFKKLHEINIEGVNLYVAECISTDEEDESTQTDEADITNLVSGSPVVTVGTTYPKFFYKQLSLKIRNKTAAQNTTATIRRIVLKVDDWR